MMYLLSQVVFEYNIHNNIKEEISSFTTVAELKNALKNTNTFTTMPYILDIKRFVQIIDTDTIEYIPRRPFAITASPIIVGYEGIRFIVSDKLMYPQDVRNILKQEYNSTLDFDVRKQWHEATPVYFSGVHEKKQYGLRNSKTGVPSFYTLRRVKCYPLGSKDIVVDGDLNQIWPQKTSDVPKELVTLLAKTKEEIHQR